MTVSEINNWFRTNAPEAITAASGSFLYFDLDCHSAIVTEDRAAMFQADFARALASGRDAYRSMRYAWPILVTHSTPWGKLPRRDRTRLAKQLRPFYGAAAIEALD